MNENYSDALNEVKDTDKKEEEKKKAIKRQIELEDVRYLMQSQQGRRFFWKLLGHCQVYGSIFNTNALTQSHNSGRQDVGHFVQGEIVQASPENYLKMQSEHQIKEKKV